jgi:hypothetical protein
MFESFILPAFSNVPSTLSNIAPHKYIGQILNITYLYKSWFKNMKKSQVKQVVLFQWVAQLYCIATAMVYSNIS